MTTPAQQQLQQAEVPVPDHFDPAIHSLAILDQLSEKYGPGWRLGDLSIDPETGERYVVATRRLSLNRITKTGGRTKTVNLDIEVKATDVDKWAAIWADQNPGYLLSSWEPHLGLAKLTKFTPGERQCRGAVADAMGVKPWQVQVQARKDGGFDVDLPKYIPSLHDAKLNEVATSTVGKPGWYVTVDTTRNRASIIPAELPTFPSAYGYPFGKVSGDPFILPVGMGLGGNGQPNRVLTMNLNDCAGMLAQGLAGSGKAQPLDSRLPVPVSEKFPTGWATVGELTAGDNVYLARGEAGQVAALSDIVLRQVFEVHLSDGQVIEAAGDHLWRVQNAGQRGRDAVHAAAKRARGSARRAASVEASNRLRQLATQMPAGAAANASTIARLAGVSAETVRRSLAPTGLARLAGGRGMHYPVGEALVALADARQATDEKRYAPGPEWSLVTTADLAEKLHSGEHKNWSISTPAPVGGPTLDLPVDPYILGAWLGDGAARHGTITVGREDFAWMRTELEAAWGGTATLRDGDPATGGNLFLGRRIAGACKRGHLNSWTPVAGGSDYCRSCRLPGEPDVRNMTLTEELSVLGLLLNKRIPAAYQRASASQRLALLQGLMDTDGTIDGAGACELTLVNEQLATDALSLTRSLGIKASMTTSAAAITERDANGTTSRRTVGVRHRIHFTTDQRVFRMPRKAARLPRQVRPTQSRLYIENVVATGRTVPMRCLVLDDPEHLYLTGDFVPTHNSVWINSVVYSALARGWQLVILDVRQKMADFLWCKDYVRDSGWGCDSKTEAVAALRLVYEEGVRRGELLTKHGVQKWQDLPASVREANPRILVVMDEAQGLFTPPPVPKALPKEHELRLEAEQEGMETDLLKVYTTKLPAEMRAAGLRLLLVSQQTQLNTGIPPAMKLNLPNKVLLGPNATKQARGHALANPDAAPEVPDWIKANEKAAKGTGVAEIEGQAPTVFKGFYASTDEYREQLRRLGVKTTRQPNPTAQQIARLVPQLNAELDDDEPPAPARGRGTGNGGGGPSEEWRPPGADQFLREHPEFGAQVSYGADGKRLKGAAAAASAGKKLNDAADRF